MTNKLNLPASYAVMNEEEMTYTQGGGCTKSTAALGIGHFLFVHDCIAGREIQFVGHSILLLYK